MDARIEMAIFFLIVAVLQIGCIFIIPNIIVDIICGFFGGSSLLFSGLLIYDRIKYKEIPKYD